MYIVQKGDAVVIVADKRPTQTEIRDRGEGSYVMRREDGSAIKDFLVTRNRKQSLNITGTTPLGLTGIKSLHLGRMLKAYSVIVKYDLSKAREILRIDHELAQRDQLVFDAQTFCSRYHIRWVSATSRKLSRKLAVTA